MTNDPNETIGGESSSEFDPAARLVAGTIFNHEYELLELLGRGGMGVIWKAKDIVGDRLVALKFVPPDVQRFESEMQRVKETFRLVHKLQHENICPLHALKEDVHLGYYLVMKYLPGQSLNDFVLSNPGRKKMELSGVATILAPVAKALDYAHRNKVIHRDIKPSNIFLVKNDQNAYEIQLIDFGLAAEIRSSMTRVSQFTINISGTRLYMAPEQWRGRQQTAATDQYALAVVAYELLAGHLPFEGGDTEMLRLAIMQDKPEPIRSIPESANAALQKALAKDKEDRYPSCEEFVKALAGEKTRQVPPQNELDTIIESVEWNHDELFAPDHFAPDKPPPHYDSMSTHGNQIDKHRKTVRVAQQKTDSIFDAVKQGDFEEFKRWYKIDPTLIRTRSEKTNKLPFFRFVAQCCPNVEILKYLVSQGTDVNEKDRWGWTPLHQALRTNSNVNVLKYLMKQVVEINEKDKHGNVLLHYAASNPRVEILKYLVSRGADVNAENKNGWTPLFFVAGGNSNVDVLKYLVNQGADINEKNKRGCVLLHYAAGNPNVEILKYLVSQGADVNEKDIDGWTPLHWASRYRSSIENLKYLVSLGADVNAKDNYGRTPLYHATKYNSNMEILKYLVSQGADVNAKTISGKTPLDSTYSNEKRIYFKNIGGKSGSWWKNFFGQ